MPVGSGFLVPEVGAVGVGAVGVGAGGGVGVGGVGDSGLDSVGDVGASVVVVVFFCLGAGPGVGVGGVGGGPASGFIGCSGSGFFASGVG